MSSTLRPDFASRQVQVEALGDADRRALTHLVDADPVVNAVMAARLRAIGTLEPAVLGGPVLGARLESGRLAAAVFCGGSLLPIGGAAPDWRLLARALRSQRRRCSSIVGRADAVREFWSVLEPAWGRARAIRTCQPLLVLDRSVQLPSADPRVRAIRVVEVDAYLPAAIAMFTAELGVSPLTTGGGPYRQRVLGLIDEGRAWGIVDDAGRVIFKADLGTLSPDTCQVQGVWVRPEVRGQGIGTAALAGVMRHALTLAPTVSLYVNDFNHRARRMYRRLGMRHAADLSTILF